MYVEHEHGQDVYFPTLYQITICAYIVKKEKKGGKKRMVTGNLSFPNTSFSERVILIYRIERKKYQDQDRCHK